MATLAPFGGSRRGRRRTRFATASMPADIQPEAGSGGGSQRAGGQRLSRSLSVTRELAERSRPKRAPTLAFTKWVRASVWDPPSDPLPAAAVAAAAAGVASDRERFTYANSGTVPRMCRGKYTGVVDGEQLVRCWRRPKGSGTARLSTSGWRWIGACRSSAATSTTYRFEHRALPEIDFGDVAHRRRLPGPRARGTAAHLMHDRWNRGCGADQPAAGGSGRGRAGRSGSRVAAQGDRRSGDRGDIPGPGVRAERCRSSPTWARCN